MTIKILGVDFRKDAVSAVLIRGSYKGIWLDAHARVPLERPEELEQGLVSCLETISGQADIANGICVAALPSDLFFYRNITSPFADPRKIDQMLPYELEQSLPVPADDLVIDFFPAESSMPERRRFFGLIQWLGLGSRPVSVPILTASIEKKHLAAYLSCLKQSGLEPERIVPGGYPLALCLMHAPRSPSNWILVDADKTHTALFLVLFRTLTVIRAFPGSGLSPSADFLYSVIQQTLLTSCESVRIDRIFLAGDIANVSEVASVLSEKSHLPVHPVNLVADADVFLKSDLPSNWRPGMGDPALAAVITRLHGFAGLNLRKADFALRASWAACRSGLLKTAVIAGLAVLAALTYVRIDTGILEKQLNFLNRRIALVLTATFPEITVIVEPLHQMRTHVQNVQRQQPDSDHKGQGRLVDVLARISSRIPESVPIEMVRLVFENSNLQLIGHTDSFNSVEEIKRRLEGPNGGFSLVTIVSANLDNTGNRIQFHLNIAI